MTSSKGSSSALLDFEKPDTYRKIQEKNQRMLEKFNKKKQKIVSAASAIASSSSSPKASVETKRGRQIPKSTASVSSDIRTVTRKPLIDLERHYRKEFDIEKVRDRKLRDQLRILVSTKRMELDLLEVGFFFF